jgi:hypothetical protein
MKAYRTFISHFIVLAAAIGMMCVAIAAGSQTYTHPTTGIAGEFVGSCEVASCSGTYTDNGGAAGNYANSINLVYRVFCPNAPGQCVSLTFNSFNMEGMVDPPGPNPMDCYFDYITIGNGATQNSPVIDQNPPSSAASTSGRICGTPAVPFTYTASNPSGCLTVRMSSDLTVNAAGWSATISCVPCAGGPTGLTNNDCTNATLLCSSSAVPANSTGPGIVAEACGGGGCPAGGENYSNWYVISIQTGGTLTFTITPTVGTDDYDYAVYGPNVGCGALGPAIRCSDSGAIGTTGLSAGAADVTESVTGDGLTAQMNVTAGQSYYILVDEWTPTGAGYTLTFGGTAVLSCLLLPIQLTDFKAVHNLSTQAVDLEWTTTSELNNDYFIVEHSVDGNEFSELEKIEGSGTTQEVHYYQTVHRHPVAGNINYYRLKQVDYDGEYAYSDIQAVMIPDVAARFYLIPNPANDITTFTYSTSFPQEDVRIYIHNSVGQLIASNRHTAQKGFNQYPYDLRALEQGIYFITLETGGQKFNATLIRTP